MLDGEMDDVSELDVVVWATHVLLPWGSLDFGTLRL